MTEEGPLPVRRFEAPRPGQHFELLQHPPEDRGKRWNPIRLQDNGRLIAMRIADIEDDPTLVSIWYRFEDIPQP